MKVLQAQSAVLSNAEVLTYLTELSAKRRSNASKDQTSALKSPNFETVVKELTSALDPAGQSPIPPYNTHYTVPNIRAVVSKLDKFAFTKAELIMIINLRPQQPVFLDSIVEECDTRLTQSQQAEVLRIVGDYLGHEEVSDDD